MPRGCALLLLVAAIAGCAAEEAASPRIAAQTPAAQPGSEGESLVPPAAKISPEDPQWGESQLRLGHDDLTRGDAVGALEHFRRIPRDASPVSLQAALAVGSIQESAGRLNEAIAAYEYVLTHQPGQHAVIERVALLYALTGQRAEADRHLCRLVRTPEFGFKPLVLLTDFERRHGDDYTRLQELERQAPDDPAVQLGLAVEDMNRGDLASARRRLEAAVDVAPQLGTAQALLGEVLLLDSSSDDVARWNRDVPASVKDHPAIWYVRGLWAEHWNEPEVAARCFWESIRQCPTSYRAIHRLGQISGDLDPEIRQSFAKYAENLHDLKENLSRVLDSGGRDEEAARNLVQLLLDSGREWEAWSWTILMRTKHPRERWLQQVLVRLSDYPHAQSPRILDSANLAIRFDLSHYPDFAGVAPRLDELSVRPQDPSPRGKIQFEDVAGRLGIEFTYHRGQVDGMEGVRMQETTGGGVGILDYDNDGWPDIFLTQGENWPAGADGPAGSPEFHDSLFRSSGGRFQDQTIPAAVPEEDGFGQGCACGDFNNDGFADIYVANVGANQLLINNGDGTFSDATPEGSLSQQAWTTSCAMADLNADGKPDLFDVNYVEGPQLFQMTCNQNDCSPEAYGEASDYALISTGDGSVRLVEADTGGRVGGGLGVVVFRPDRDPTLPSPASDQTAGLTPEVHLSLFVANDQDPNAFLTLADSADSSRFAFKDESFRAGLALDRNGKTTACMGVAAGDLTGEGRLDLFVTNYKDEANSFYVQESGGLFSDSIGSSGLLHAGLPYVGWGTQCLDADNDGHLDLIVANGHVGEFGEAGVDYRMPTQVFINRGGGYFHQLRPNELGSFFERRILGRSLATLDWNRDGRTDVVLSLLDDNVALLTNQSSEIGNWLALRLIGTDSPRDAIGTVVTICTKEKLIRRQLTAGDGYHATNERVIRIGIGRNQLVDKLTLEWPSGKFQEFTNLPTNVLLLAPEGQSYLPSPVGLQVPAASAAEASDALD